MGTRPARLPFRRRQLARTLRLARERAGLTQREAARPLRFSEAKMSRVENGQLPDFHELRAMLDVYGLTVSEWEPVIDLWELAQRKGWWIAHGLDDQGYVSMEDEASEVDEFQPGFIPGLLQTEAYIRAVFDESDIPRSRSWINNQVTVRLRRQERLFGDDPLIFYAIIAESVLREDGNPTIMLPQLHRLAERAALPNVTLRVLPGRRGLHDGLLGTFTVLHFPEADDPDLAYVEHAFGSLHIEERSQVAAARLRFDSLSRLALSPADSLAMIEEIAAGR